MYDVTCDMKDKDGVGVTVISHDSESRTLVKDYEGPGSYSRDISYTGASLSQLASLTNVSSHCEQFIKYECKGSALNKNEKKVGWWVSRSSSEMLYWGGATPGSGKCACGMNNTCAGYKNYVCNCDKTMINGVRTAVSLRTRQVFQSYNSSLETLVLMAIEARRDTTRLGNSSVLEQN